MDDFRFRVFDQNDQSIVWAGSGKREASGNFENAVQAIRAAGIHTYLTLQELKAGSYHTIKAKVI